MFPAVRMKRARANKDRLPIRYRCKDKFNRALEANMQRFIASDSVSDEDTAVENKQPLDSSSRYIWDANTIGINMKLLLSSMYDHIW